MGLRLMRIIALVCCLTAVASFYPVLLLVRQAPIPETLDDTVGLWTIAKGQIHPMPKIKDLAKREKYLAGDTTSTGNNNTLLRAAIVALVRDSDLDGICATIRQVEDRFNREFGYLYILLNDEDFTQEFMDSVRAVTEAKVYFGKLPASHRRLSPYVTEEKVKAALERNKNRCLYGGSYSYRLMCRYRFGFIHKHPLLANLDYYWRIEPGAKYYCNIPYDPFRFMRDKNIVYGFTITPTEKNKAVETLWTTTRQWMLENPEILPEKSFIQWAVDKSGEYTRCPFWSSFEIVDLSFYRSAAYKSYFQHLDRAGGFFYEQWGDAPVHSIAASMLLRKEQIHWFEDIGYYYPGYTHCPNKPEMQRNCICNKKSGFVYHDMCSRRFTEVRNINKGQVLALAHLPDRK